MQFVATIANMPKTIIARTAAEAAKAAGIRFASGAGRVSARRDPVMSRHGAVYHLTQRGEWIGSVCVRKAE